MYQNSTFLKYWRVIEEAAETIVFASRWLLAPFYIGLSISILVLLIHFMKELWHLLTHAFTMTESGVIVGVLSLVDMALTGSLLIIVIFSGYENFVSRIDHAGHKDWPQWMGTIDFSALKLKLLSSIVAISAIQLLKQFMKLNEISDRDLYFLIGIHVVFVVSSVLLALSDRISGHGNGHGSAPEGHLAPHAPKHDAHEPSAAPARREHEMLVAALESKDATSKPPQSAAVAAGKEAPRDGGRKGHK